MSSHFTDQVYSFPYFAVSIPHTTPRSGISPTNVHHSRTNERTDGEFEIGISQRKLEAKRKCGKRKAKSERKKASKRRKEGKGMKISNKISNKTHDERETGQRNGGTTERKGRKSRFAIKK